MLQHSTLKQIKKHFLIKIGILKQLTQKDVSLK